MKVLIADDEKLTRSGLISSIDWDSLGIEEVFEASNGIEGLQKARTEKPDIILTDMRMPRMDGATMAEKLRDVTGLSLREIYQDLLILDAERENEATAKA